MKVRILFKGGASSIDVEISEEAYKELKKVSVVAKDTLQKEVLINPSSISTVSRRE